ncbi:Imm52 family immunity protein [Archangium lansingense]|uniref:Imm52 family immunity protein n=1 Tax=Archangium lansingense TaxID=2995310 RepID=UPI003B7F72CB
MSEPYYAGAYWGCRTESAEECARRAETFFRLLSAAHPDYTRWFEQANSTKRALQLPFEPSFRHVRALLRQEEVPGWERRLQLRRLDGPP